MKFKHIRTGAILEPHNDFVLEQFQNGKDVFRSLRLTNIAANQDGDERFFSFRFDVRLNFVITPEVIPTMYFLDQNNTIRSEV